MSMNCSNLSAYVYMHQINSIRRWPDFEHFYLLLNKINLVVDGSRERVKVRVLFHKERVWAIIIIIWISDRQWLIAADSGPPRGIINDSKSERRNASITLERGAQSRRCLQVAIRDFNFIRWKSARLSIPLLDTCLTQETRSHETVEHSSWALPLVTDQKNVLNSFT